MKKHWLWPFLVMSALPARVFAGAYITQATFPVSYSTVAGMDRDAVGNLYVVGLVSGATTYRVTGYSAPGLSPLFSFDTGVSSLAAFAVEGSGVIDVLSSTDTMNFNLLRFTNPGTLIAQASYFISYLPPNMYSAAIDKTNARLYIAYQYTYHPIYLQCLGCGGPSTVTKTSVGQYDLQGNHLSGFSMPGADSTPGSCYTPTATAVDPQGNYYVADGNCQQLLKFSSAGSLQSSTPASSWSYSFGPRGMWTDPASNVYISETVCGISGCPLGVVKLNSGGAFQSSFAADSAVGCAWDQRILYLNSAGSQPVRRFVFNGAPSVPAESGPFGMVVQHSSAAALSWQASSDPDGDPITYTAYLGTNPTQLAPAGTASQAAFTTQSLTFGVTYYWQIVAQDSYLGLPLQQIQAPVESFNLNLINHAPAAFGVAAGTGTAVTRATSATLAWQPAVDPDGDPVAYDVLWGAAPQSLALVGTTSATSWPVSNLAFGTTYYWSIRARDVYAATTLLAGGAAQPYSQVFKNLPPAAPTITSGSGLLQEHTLTPAATLGWSTSVDPDGDPVSYRLYIGASPNALTLMQDGAQTSFALNGLSFGTTYYWRVDAYDPYGGVGSTAVQTLIVLLQNNPPQPFAILTGAGTLDTRSTSQALSWASALDLDGDAVAYSLALSTDPAALGVVQASTATSFALNFQFGTTYYWQVTARDSFGGATASGVQSFLPTFLNHPPSAPANFSPTGAIAYHGFSPSQTFFWGSSIDPDGDAVSYQLLSGTAAASLTPVASAASGYTAPLALSTSYYYKITATDVYGAVSNSVTNWVEYQFSNRPPQPFSVVSGSGTISTRSTSDLLAWTAANDPDGDPVSYGVFFGTNSAALALLATTNQNSLGVDQLSFGTPYFWRIDAYDGYGGTTTVSGSTQTLVHIFADAPPSPIVYLSTAGVYGLHTAAPAVTLSWAPSNNIYGDPISYQLQVQTSTGAWPAIALGQATQATLPLQFETTYFWQVIAADPYGGASTGAWRSFIAHLANQPPGAFAPVTGTGSLATRGTTQVLSWSPSVDPDGDAVTYQLAVASSPAGLQFVQTSTATSYTLGFQLGTTYYWQVTARDSFGGSTSLGVQSFAPSFLNRPPTVPVNQSKTGTILYHGFAPSQTFFWQASSDPDGDAFTYSLYYGTDSSHMAVVSPVPLGFTLPAPLNVAFYYSVVATDIYGAASASPVNWIYYQFTDNPPGPFDVLSTTGTLSARQTNTNLSWTPSADPDGDPVSYGVFLGTAPSALSLLANTTKTSAAVGALAFGTTYYWRVDAYDGFGATTTANAGVQSLSYAFYDPPPSPIVYLSTASSYNEHTSVPSVALSWAASTNAAGDPISYRLDVQTATGSWPTASLGASTSLSLPVVFETTYTWRVTAFDPYGGTSTGAWMSFGAHLANQPPLPIQYLTPPSVSTRAASFGLAWANSGDPDGDLVSYRLDLGASPNAMASVQAGTATAYALPLQFGTTVYYRVTASDSFGAITSGPIQTFCASFLNDPPQTPNIVSPFTKSPTVKTMKNSVEVSWQQVSDPEGDPITYTVYLGNAPGDMTTLATIAQTTLSGATALALRPAAVRPQSEVTVDSDTVKLTLSGLDYYKSYYLRVAASNPYGASTTTGVQQFTLASADGFPKAYNYPNPFSPLRGGTNIVFNAPPSGYAKATVEVYSELQDLLFRQDYFNIPPGISQVHFDGRDRNGRAFYNGSYIARVLFSGPDDKQVFYLLVVK